MDGRDPRPSPRAGKPDHDSSGMKARDRALALWPTRRPSTSKKVARKAATKRSAKPALLAGGNLRSRRPTATPPCKPTSRPCRAGNATSAAASTRSSRAPSPGSRKAVKWNSPFYGVEGERERKDGWFLAFIASRSTSKWLSSAARRCVPAPPGASKQQGRALPRHPRGRPARRSPAHRLGEASRRLPGERM